MPSILIAVLFLISSLISFGLIFFNLSHVIGQQLLSVILLISLLLMGKFGTKNQTSSVVIKAFGVLVSSLLVQILVISSGGLYSPLLIVIHIYTIGAIFLLNNKSPIFFLLFSLAVLLLQLRFDSILTLTFKGDPWTAVIYGLSFLIIIPLILYLSHSYFIKDTFTKLLKNYIQMQEQKETSILTALEDLVVITDPTLRIISANISAEKFLRKDISEIINKQFFDIFAFKDIAGNKGGIDSLSINQALADKASRFVEGYMLETENTLKPKPVLIQVRPLTDQQNMVTQIVFVMSDPASKQNTKVHSNVREALRRKNVLMETLSKIEPNTPYSSVKAMLGFICHIEEDIALSQELEDHSLKENPVFVDVVALVKEILNQENLLGNFLGIKTTLEFNDPDGREKASLSVNETPASTDLAPSPYTMPLEKNMFTLAMKKALEMAMLIASGTSDREVMVTIDSPQKSTIYIQIVIINPNLTENEMADIFILNNPLVGHKTHLDFGSGVEGYLVKKICTLLNIPVTIKIIPTNQKIAFEFTLSKEIRG